MATQAAIDDVLNLLPTEADSIGITTTIISNVIDSGVSHAKIMLKIWQIFAGKVSALIDISESGSSRAQGVLFARAKEMIDYWQIRSDVEDQQSEILPARAHGVSHTAVRI